MNLVLNLNSLYYAFIDNIPSPQQINNSVLDLLAGRCACCQFDYVVKMCHLLFIESVQAHVKPLTHNKDAKLHTCFTVFE